MDIDVGHRGWVQRLNAKVGHRELDTEVGHRGWTQTLDEGVGHRGWTIYIGWTQRLEVSQRLDTEVGHIDVGCRGWA